MSKVTITFRRTCVLAVWMAGILLLIPQSAKSGYGCPGYFGMLPWVDGLAVQGSQIVPDTSNNKWRGARTARTRGCSSLVPYKISENDHNEIAVECLRQGDDVFFGIAFYAGEGSYGVGGIGKYNPHTRLLEIRRPALLKEYSVAGLAHDGESLWIATMHHGEGFGGSANGLVRYNWQLDHAESFVGTSDGPCGFWINDLLWKGGQLWVATDLGMSRFDKATGSWAHFVPVNNSGKALRETSCEKLYMELLDSLPDEIHPWDGACPLSSLGKFTPRNIFRAYLQRYHPDTLQRLEAK